MWFSNRAERGSRWWRLDDGNLEGGLLGCDLQVEDGWVGGSITFVTLCGGGEGRFDAAICGNTGYTVLTGQKIYCNSAFKVNHIKIEFIMERRCSRGRF